LQNNSGAWRSIKETHPLQRMRRLHLASLYLRFDFCVPWIGYMLHSKQLHPGLADFFPRERGKSPPMFSRKPHGINGLGRSANRRSVENKGVIDRHFKFKCCPSASGHRESRQPQKNRRQGDRPLPPPVTVQPHLLSACTLVLLNLDPALAADY
jgi:hypothetical protein